ncbi:exocyst complex component Sec10-domain-containing protein [Collybia nuda]|uniref:Exocyst complex component Sec10-domain-containing protein n=1 Tax=Collybia nuda TaxID=64659 RepID=A0A9P5XZR0_9AGAR|nr:exocyst complex component Sec10-domain-containing protein [Collybia nuda]
MEKFATLEPVRLYSRAFASNPVPSTQDVAPPPPMIGRILASTPIGRLPALIHAQIIRYLPVPDIPAYARVCRSANAVVEDEEFWARRWKVLRIVSHEKQDVEDSPGSGKAKEGTTPFEEVLDLLEGRGQEKSGLEKAASVAIVEAEVDEFGDFAEADLGGQHIRLAGDDEMGDFVGGGSGGGGGFGGFNLFGSTPAPEPLPLPVTTKQPSTTKQLYKRAHILLKPLAVTALSPSTPPHQVLTALGAYITPAMVSPPPSASSSLMSATHSTQPTLLTQSTLLALLARFLSPNLQPLRNWAVFGSALRTAMDRFDASLLAAFDGADGRGDEAGMREAAEASWGVWTALEGGGIVGAGDWEMGKVWAEKREIFYEQGKWDPLDNITSENSLDFTAMDEFMGSVLASLHEHGARAVRVFPPAAQVLLAFGDRIAGEVVGEYVGTLLTRARELQAEELHGGSAMAGGQDLPAYSGTFLKAVAATFREAWRMVDVIMTAAAERADSGVRKERAEDVVYRMFESNMDEYLDEEVESVKHILETICKGWDREASKASSPGMNNADAHPRFLSSQNPAQEKRNVLASFTSVLLLPVTIVPRMGRGVGGVLMTGGTAAVQGIAMLNPQRWGSTTNSARSGGGGVSTSGWGIGSNPSVGSTNPGKVEDDATLFELGADEEDEDEDDVKEKKEAEEEDPWAAREKADSRPRSMPPSETPTVVARTNSTQDAVPSHTRNLSKQSATTENKLELLLSLDIALEVIHADRESLKRVETFSGYPGHYGHRVRDTIEEVFILMLQALGEGHLSKGFAQATEQMTTYKPAEHAETTSVAPLLQFFELVHIGDTIQSMVQVYFDKELAHHIDKTDFLNAVVREKKRFENTLDDSVAAGLNAGTEVLMNQVEHIILTLTKPREYYPPEDGPLDLGPTKGCTEAIKCLDMHCRLLKGSTSKDVLEVFYQEIGIRLIAILQKHIKRQIISLNGGFQVIADLNTYHAFISSLKVPTITSEFSHLKMLGHVYVVEDAKDLAQIVRDVTRYGGAYRPEDIYEFIQRRSDWKKIEKIVDKTMYNLSFKEDCIIC